MFRSSVFALLLTVLHAVSSAAEKPNFIVLIADDISYDDIGCYGSLNGRTPHLDSLAKEGLKFTNAILTASSCSPSRCSILTGRYPHNNGEAAELHRPIAWHIPSVSGMLRDAGYYAALAGKNHMTWSDAPEGEKAPTQAFDKIYGTKVPGNSGGHGNWIKAIDECPEEKPFFLWLAALDAHRAWDGDGEWDESKFGPKHNPDTVILPPALLDRPETRTDFASYLNEVTRFDWYVGEVVRHLKENGTFSNTQIFVIADNGRPFPRAKTRLHDDGMKTYFITTGPAVKKTGETSSSLISVIDIAPTVCEMAGIENTPTLQGRSLLPVLQNPTEQIRPYAFSEHNWHDYEALGRSVRDGKYLYIINDRTESAWQGPADSVKSASFQDLLSANRSAELLTPLQQDIFQAPRPKTELYDTSGDPHQIDNLSGNATYESVEKRLAEALSFWRKETGDSSPDEISKDFFDRETGDRLKMLRKDYQRPPPGADRKADRSNADGLE
ncbi:MAG: sulfatase [Verrucomicrobiales bacterium]|nr:sulfatase [Verrucomicrobiales bacterium]